MIKRIEFNLNGKIACINASSLTTMKLWMSTPPFIKVNWEELSADEKLKILKQVFDGSIHRVPMPTEKKTKGSKIDAFGFSNWTSFAKNGRHCSMKFVPDIDQYEFLPLIYVNKEGGLQGVTKAIEKISAASSSDEIISRLDRTLEKIPALAKEYHNNVDDS